MATPQQGKLPISTFSNGAFNNQKQKARIFYLASITGTTGHVAFIFLFLALQQPVLAYFNILSAAIWLVTFLLNKRHRHDLTTLLICTEVFSHAALATYLLGAQSGFQFYLWPLALLLMAVPALSIRWSTVMAICSITLFGALSLMTSRSTLLAMHYHTALYVGNLALASLPFIITAAASRYIYERQYLKLAKLAERDDLTKLYNRRFGQQMLRYYFRQMEPESEPICIALVDVDQFKQINDKLGHGVGDDTLVKISQYLSNGLRDTDICSRWGGEEFLFILPNATVEEMHKRLDILCREMPKEILVPDWDNPISCSFGLIQAKVDEPLRVALNRVDELLYEAKKNGRYQVVSDHSKSISIDPIEMPGDTI